MTAEQIARASKSHLDEYFDGFILVGFVAGTGQPMVLRDLPDPKTLMALNFLLLRCLDPNTQGEQHGD